MKVEVIILIKCNEQVERAQKYAACIRVEKEIQKIKGIESASYTGNSDADITAFANWEEKDIPSHVKDLEGIHGVENVTVKILEYHNR